MKMQYISGIDIINPDVSNLDLPDNIKKLDYLLSFLYDEKSKKINCLPEQAKKLLDKLDETVLFIEQNFDKYKDKGEDSKRWNNKQYLTVLYIVNALILLSQNVDVSKSKSAGILRDKFIGRYCTLFLNTDILSRIIDKNGERLALLKIIGKDFFQKSIEHGYQFASTSPHPPYPGLLNMLSKNDAWEFIKMFDQSFLQKKLTPSKDNNFASYWLSVLPCLPREKEGEFLALIGIKQRQDENKEESSSIQLFKYPKRYFSEELNQSYSPEELTKRGLIPD